MTKLERAKFRVKIRILLEEARIIRYEERKAARGPDHNTLHLHRIGILRSESRSTQLAYGFARGVPYGVTESSARRPDLRRIAAVVRSLTCREALPHDVEAWMKEVPIPTT